MEVEERTTELQEVHKHCKAHTNTAVTCSLAHSLTRSLHPLNRLPHPPTHPPTHQSAHSFLLQSLNHGLDRSIACLLAHSITQSLIDPLTHSLDLSLACSITRSFIRSHMHSNTHAPIGSYTHLLVHHLSRACIYSYGPI